MVLSNEEERRILVDMFAQFRDWTDAKLWLYDKQGTVQWKRACAVARYCSKELAIKHFFIDSLMKCVQGEDDYNGQKAFVDELCSIARDENIHIHLVHHVKKPSIDGKKPGKYDFKGTGSVTDQVDNVIAVWRNKQRERDRQANKILSDTEPDQMLIVDKQRNGNGWEGYIGLWFHEQSTQFLGGNNNQPMEFFE
jgi:twinkle protein